MKYLTKIFVSSVIMSSVAYAEFVSDIHIGISNAKVLDESYTEFNGGYGFNKYFSPDASSAAALVLAAMPLFSIFLYTMC